MLDFKVKLAVEKIVEFIVRQKVNIVVPLVRLNKVIVSHQFKFPSDLSIIRVTKESEIPVVLVALLTGNVRL
jgi:hypothetical protein